jgi:hypothetical protein
MKIIQYLLDFKQKHKGQLTTSLKDINNFCKDIKTFKGCYFKDTINSLKETGFYILALTPLKQLLKKSKTTHWICIVSLPKEILYLDSFGMDPDKKIYKLMKQTEKKCLISTWKYQDTETSYCGFLSIFFGILLSKKRGIKNIVACLENDCVRIKELLDYIEINKKGEEITENK